MDLEKELRYQANRLVMMEKMLSDLWETLKNLKQKFEDHLYGGVVFP